MTSEHTAAAEGALLHVRPDLGVFAVTGKDRLSWLNGLVTQEVGKLSPGTGAYGLAVGKTGKMAAELWFVAGQAGDPRVLVVADRARLEALREHLDRHLIMEDAEMSPPLDRAVVFAHGPRAAAAVTAARALGADAASIDWTGRGDAAVIVAPEGGLDATLAGLQAQVTPTALATEAGWEALRIAWGVPRAGVDYDDHTLPQEASLEKLAVSFSKGCYLGQETVFMLEKRGHAKRKLVRLAVSGDGEVAAGAELTLPDGTAVGAVTSAARAPDGGLRAIGSLKYKHAVAGAEVLVSGRSARVLGLAADGAAGGS
jgi:folate-binding protein YgfZ